MLFGVLDVDGVRHLTPSGAARAVFGFENYRITSEGGTTAWAAAGCADPWGWHSDAVALLGTYCGQCGTEADDADTFCASCGEPIVAGALVLERTRPVPAALYAPAAPMPVSTNGMAIAALICGILGVLGGLPSILALVFGYVGRRQIDESRGMSGGRGLAIAGIVLGWIGLALLVLWIILIIVVIAAARHNPS